MDEKTVITEIVYHALDKNIAARIVTSDISKIFDRVWHVGVRSNFCHDLMFLKKSCNGSHVIRLYLYNNTGFPAGLCPWNYFLIFVNDLRDVISSQIATYAEDATI